MLASLALAENLEAERAALDRHWRQRRERAAYEVERARRQYAAVEPENRLVARSLERGWEAALSEEARLAAEYERWKRTQAQRPSPAELAAIRELSDDLPALWRAETTTQAERQTLVRLLVERVLVEVAGESERVRVECHWQGGLRTTHELIRPVARLAGLSTYAALTARAVELRREGRDYAGIADTQPRRLAPGQAPRHVQRADGASFADPIGAETVRYRRRPRPLDRRANEWTIRELAEQIGMPQPTLYTWIQKGRLSCRNADGSRREKLAVRRSGNDRLR